MRLSYKQYSLEIIFSKFPDWKQAWIKAIEGGEYLRAIKIYKDNTHKDLKTCVDYMKQIKEHFELTGKIKTKF